MKRLRVATIGAIAIASPAVAAQPDAGTYVVSSQVAEHTGGTTCPYPFSIGDGEEIFSYPGPGKKGATLSYFTSTQFNAEAVVEVALPRTPALGQINWSGKFTATGVQAPGAAGTFTAQFFFGTEHAFAGQLSVVFPSPIGQGTCNSTLLLAFIKVS